jgi:hypothetical protein
VLNCYLIEHRGLNIAAPSGKVRYANVVKRAEPNGSTKIKDIAAFIGVRLRKDVLAELPMSC